MKRVSQVLSFLAVAALGRFLDEVYPAVEPDIVPPAEQPRRAPAVAPADAFAAAHVPMLEQLARIAAYNAGAFGAAPVSSWELVPLRMQVRAQVRQWAAYYGPTFEEVDPHALRCEGPVWDRLYTLGATVGLSARDVENHFLHGLNAASGYSARGEAVHA